MKVSSGPTPHFVPPNYSKNKIEFPAVALKSLTYPGNITMGRPKGSKNRRTLLREAEEHVGDKCTDAVLDSLYVIECSMRHFFLRAEMGQEHRRRKR